MKIEHLKPIPEKIKKQIEIADNTISSYFNLARFYSYLTTVDKELVKITVAVRNYENHLLIKQVAVHGVDSENCFVRDMEYNFLGISPFKVGWYELGVKYPTSKKPSYEDGKWYEAPYSTVPVLPLLWLIITILQRGHTNFTFPSEFLYPVSFVAQFKQHI